MPERTRDTRSCHLMARNDCFTVNYPGNPHPGDLIEVFRPGYQHWVLYLGDGYVINLAPIDGIPSTFTSAKSVFSKKALVKMQLLKEVVGNDRYRINNKYDETYHPLPVDEVMQRSEFVIGQEVAYNLLVNNCEHFVTLLRYGEGISEQVLNKRVNPFKRRKGGVMQWELIQRFLHCDIYFIGIILFDLQNSMRTFHMGILFIS